MTTSIYTTKSEMKKTSTSHLFGCRYQTAPKMCQTENRRHHFPKLSFSFNTTCFENACRFFCEYVSFAKTHAPLIHTHTKKTFESRN